MPPFVNAHVHSISLYNEATRPCSSACARETAYIAAESSKGLNTQLLEWSIGDFNLTRLWLQ